MNHAIAHLDIAAQIAEHNAVSEAQVVTLRRRCSTRSPPTAAKALDVLEQLESQRELLHAGRPDRAVQRAENPRAGDARQ
ncbi:hypothetical protein [Pseudomonas aeruginosa]|uniref:hypothetical protein n=1 Tax=Pseudomonas aeruginosa TaxID=287 RepID=UPI003D7F6265